jgi:hypothetical protein
MSVTWLSYRITTNLIKYRWREFFLTKTAQVNKKHFNSASGIQTREFTIWSVQDRTYLRPRNHCDLQFYCILICTWLFNFLYFAWHLGLCSMKISTFKFNTVYCCKVSRESSDQIEVRNFLNTNNIYIYCFRTSSRDAELSKCKIFLICNKMFTTVM